VSAFLGDGDGGFLAAVQLGALPYPNVSSDSSTQTLFLADLNRDGFPDVVAAAQTSSELAVLLHVADGGYRATLYPFPDLVTAASLPRPGAPPDLVVGYDESVQILVNAGDGTFSDGPVTAVPNLAQHLQVADFDGDCIPDVAVSGPGCAIQGHGLSVLYGNPDGGLGDPQSLPTDLNLGSTGELTVLGPTVGPRALAALSECVTYYGLVVYGDPSLP
jgi:hypothetical protein